MIDLNNLTWSVSRLSEAIEALAQMNDLMPRAVEVPSTPEDLMKNDLETVGQWIESIASWLGLEAELVETPYIDVNKLIHAAGPALIQLPNKGELQFLAVLGGRRRLVSVLGPDLKVYKVHQELICEALCEELEASIVKDIDYMLEKAGVPMGRRERAKVSILRQRLSSARIGGCWLLRLSHTTSFWQQIRFARLPSRLIAFVGSHAVFYLLWILSWWLIGRGALQGRLEIGWIIAWTLLLLTMIPFRLLSTWLQGVLAIRAGGILKQRLLHGALRLEPEEIRHQGAGQLLGRVIESEAVESLSLSGGLLGLVATIELVMAIAILITGVGVWLLVFLLVGWLAISFLFGWRYLRHRILWTEARLNITHDLVEQMVGHRTRIAQQMPEHWHDGEDQSLARYLELSGVMDRTTTLLMAVVPRGWLVLGFLGITPAFVSGNISSSAIAVSLGGILLAFGALKKLTTSILHVAGAVISWQQVSQLFHAAARSEKAGSPVYALIKMSEIETDWDKQPIVEAHDLVFSYQRRGYPVLQGCNLSICMGDQILLEGSSGTGKSTLCSLLTGLRIPESGLLLVNGLDLKTLGSEGWRQRVVAAPQFHENHILTETFAFNLLMGRRWPPRREDLQAAKDICHELGLGELLDQMPAGLSQMVGETGWQLSNGEKSRLYIARALLQDADLIILDESFAALDPENLEQALRCVLDRASTVLVIAHP